MYVYFHKYINIQHINSVNTARRRSLAPSPDDEDCY